MIQSFAFLYIPGRNCDKYRNFLGLYSHVFLYIRRSLLVMNHWQLAFQINSLGTQRIVRNCVAFEVIILQVLDF